ncbi:pyruvate kinase [Candidatus Woesearchaeota archaeon]|nr:pyruvate kinase [Candidatus Woesearchaeota archaeon]
MKKTKILCTIGPASMSKKTMQQMLKAGMNGIRINTSHGTFDQYNKIIKNIRELDNIPIIIDTNGPEVRINCKSELLVNTGDKIEIGFNNKSTAWFDYDFYKKIKPGMLIMINDGLLQLKLVKKRNKALVLEALTAGLLQNRKGVNLPNLNLGLPILTKKDEEVIKFSNKMDVDFIALSFTRTPQDVKLVRRKLNNDIGIIAKIENSQGIENFDSLLPIVEGIMVARGDLGVEIPSQKIPIIQKDIVKRCNQQSKLVIIATQMLESMITNPLPTRAETSDVANAILDGADTIMLSGETTIGRYPVNSVTEMSKIALDVENNVKSNVKEQGNIGVSEAISSTIFQLCRLLPISKVVTITRSGYTARMISRFRLRQSIIAVTKNRKVRNRLQLYFGVEPVCFSSTVKSDKIVSSARFLHNKGLVKKDELVLFSSGAYSAKKTTNLLGVHKISDILS